MILDLFPDQAFADDDDDRIAALDLDYSLLFGRRVSGATPARGKKMASKIPTFQSALLDAAAQHEAEAAGLLIEAERRVWASEPAVELIERAKHLEHLAQVTRDVASTPWF